MPHQNKRGATEVDVIEELAVSVIDGQFYLGTKKHGHEPGRTVTAAGAVQIKTSTSPKRVLLVEDNLDSVHTLAYLVRTMGHTVEYAINGYVALDVAKRFRPEIVLLDIGLPGIDGFEVCRQIKKEPSLQTCRVIALTAFSQEDYRKRALGVGCELYIVKPIDVKVLEELLG